MDTSGARVVTVVGTASPTVWSQAEVIRDQDRTYIALISLSYIGDSDVVDLVSVGSSLLSQVLEKKELITTTLDGIEGSIETTLLFATLNPNSLTVRSIGDVSTLIYRNSKLGEIVGKSTDIRTLHGPILPNDILFFTSGQLRRTIPIDTTHDILTQGVQSAELLGVLIHKQKDSSGLAGVIVQNLPINQPATHARVTEGWKEKISIQIAKLSTASPLYISQEKRTKNLWIGSFLLILLFMGVVIGVVRRGMLEKEKIYTDLQTRVEQKIAEAKSIGDLNPGRAKILLEESNAEIDNYLSGTAPRTYKEKVSGLKDSIRYTETEVFKKQQTSVTTLVELSVLRPGMAATTFFGDPKGNLILPDTTSPAIVVINSADKSSYSLNPADLGTIRELAVYNKEVYGLRSDGVFEISQKENKKIIEPDELWGDARLLEVFAGNVYVFDKGNGEIWKYPALDDGFGARRRWLAAGIQPDLSRVIDMKVNGDIWLLTSSGKIAHYSQGVPKDFSMDGFPSLHDDLLSDPRAISVVDGMVYVLETGAQRVVVFNEEGGTYEKQYSAAELGQGQDMVVYEGKVYVLLPDRIVWFPL